MKKLILAAIAAVALAVPAVESATAIASPHIADTEEVTIWTFCTGWNGEGEEWVYWFDCEEEYGRYLEEHPPHFECPKGFAC